MIQTAQQTALFLGARLDPQRRGLRRGTLHRLLFLAQSWHMVSHGCALFPEPILAAPTGPVIGPLIGPLDDPAPLPRFAAAQADVPARAFLQGFCQTYAAADGEAIAQQTDREDGAWALTRLIAGDGAVIHPDLMRTTFRLMLLDHADALRRRGGKGPAAARPDPQAPGGNVIAFRRA